jgi:broad specificity phosphatase PhoE
LLLVRHSEPARDPAVPAEEWPLSNEGRRRWNALAERLAAFSPVALLTSPEPKALETAQLVAPRLGLGVDVEDGLRETGRRTVGWLPPDDLDGGVRALFDRPDEIVFGEESGAHALARFQAAVADVPEPAVVVTDGTILSLFAAARTGRDAYEIWRGLVLPDIVAVPCS